MALVLAACGGGGGGGGSKETSPPPTPGAGGPPAAVTLTPKGPIRQAVPTGEPFTTTLEVVVTGSNLAAADQIFLRIGDTTGTFSAPIPQQAQPDQTFRYALNPRGDLPPGNYSGQLQITPCRDGQCASAWGAPVSVDYRVDVSSLDEWTTLQGDANHDGYVPTTLDPTRLQLAWEWQPPRDPASVGGFVVRPVTAGGNVYVMGGSVMSDESQRGVAIHALSEYNGRPFWSYATPEAPRKLAPSAGAVVVILPMINNNTLLTALSASSGAVRYTYAQDTTLGAQILPPTSFGGRTYFFAGVVGDEIHAMDSVSGQRLWARPRVDSLPATPSINAENVFYQAPRSLEILDYVTGATVASIPDPSSRGQGGSPDTSAVVLGSLDNALMNSYDALTTRAPISSFDIAGRRWQWTTQHSYFTLFAVAEGTIYASRRPATVPTLDAIDEATGQLLWSWSPPASEAQTLSVGNILATRNVVYFSTEGATTSSLWAIDRATHQVAWRYPNGGYVAMSGSRTLLVLSGRPGETYDSLRAFRIP